MTESPHRRPLTAGERLVCIGAAVILASMLLPWYGIRFSGLSSSGFDSFGFGAVALLVTAGAAVVIVIREAAGRPPSRPLRSAELVIVAGIWAAAIGVYLVFDRPDELAGSTEISPQLGIFVAIGGAAAIVVAGMRMRSERA
jgi:protein-S-isoprenylcysteine O-methyltransferase Ste14